MQQLSIRALLGGERKPAPPLIKKPSKEGQTVLAQAATLPRAAKPGRSGAAAPPPAEPAAAEASPQPPAKRNKTNWTSSQRQFALNKLDKFKGKHRRARCLE